MIASNMAHLSFRFENERLMRALSRWLALLLGLAAGLGGVSVCARADNAMVLVEAEQFADLGGWVVDQQFMDQMGSPYLLAHGLGGAGARRHDDGEFFRAAGNIASGCAPGIGWRRGKRPGAPGKFQVLLNGQPLRDHLRHRGGRVALAGWRHVRVWAARRQSPCMI